MTAPYVPGSRTFVAYDGYPEFHERLVVGHVLVGHVLVEVVAVQQVLVVHVMAGVVGCVVVARVGLPLVVLVAEVVVGGRPG